MNIETQDLSGIVEHLGAVMKSAQSLATHHNAMEASHEHLHKMSKAHSAAHKAARASGSMTSELHAAHDAHMKAHESSRLSRLGYKAEHARHIDKVANAFSHISKVLGGGTERVSAPGEPSNLPSRLNTSNAAEANKSNHSSPFDALRKASIGAPRVFRNASNPMWTGRG